MTGYYQSMLKFTAKALLFSSGLLLGVRNADMIGDVGSSLKHYVIDYLDESDDAGSQTHHLKSHYASLDQLVGMTYEYHSKIPKKR